MEQTRLCWICYSEESLVENGDVFEENWVSPCLCHGTTRWVHKDCVLEWIDKRQNGDVLYNVSCSQCQHRYTVTEKTLVPSPVRVLIKFGRKVAGKISVGFAIYEIVFSVYSICFCFGAFTVFLCVGVEESACFFHLYCHDLLNLFLQPSRQTVSRNLFRMLSLFVMKIGIGVPLIPVLLLSLDFWRLRWFYVLIPMIVMYENQFQLSFSSYSFCLICLPFCVIVYQKLQGIIPMVIAKIFGCNYTTKELEEEAAVDPALSDVFDNENALRISVLSVAKVLALPLVSSLVGFVFFRKTSIKNLHRTLLGGSLFVLSRDIFCSIHRFNTLYSKKNRRIFCHQKGKMSN